MVLDLTLMSISSFIIVSLLLAIFSILDVRDRRVKNEFFLTGVIIGSLILLFTEHFAFNSVLHLTAIVIVVLLSYILFRIGSIGGADFKALFTVGLLSPGIELGEWGQPILEAIIGLGGQLIVMLLGGYLYWRLKNKENTPPLIPFLLAGYLIIQIVALF